MYVFSSVPCYSFLFENTYGIRQKEFNKHAAAAPEKNGGMCTAFLLPRVLHFDGRTAVRRLVNCRNPWMQSMSVPRLRKLPLSNRGQLNVNRHGSSVAV